MSESLSKKTLDEATAAITARQANYGSPLANFQRIAALWGGYKGVEFSAVDVAAMCIMIKVGRIMETPEHVDSWVDIAGYAACGRDVSDYEFGENKKNALAEERAKANFAEKQWPVHCDSVRGHLAGGHRKDTSLQKGVAQNVETKESFPAVHSLPCLEAVLKGNLRSLSLAFAWTDSPQGDATWRAVRYGETSITSSQYEWLKRLRADHLKKNSS